jgi:hypothetical protein
MAESIRCPHCGKTYVMKPELAGKKVRCRQCEKGFSVPAPKPPAGDADEPILLSLAPAAAAPPKPDIYDVMKEDLPPVLAAIAVEPIAPLQKTVFGPPAPRQQGPFGKVLLQRIGERKLSTAVAVVSLGLMFFYAVLFFASGQPWFLVVLPLGGMGLAALGLGLPVVQRSSRVGRWFHPIAIRVALGTGFVAAGLLAADVVLVLVMRSARAVSGSASGIAAVLGGLAFLGFILFLAACVLTIVGSLLWTGVRRHGMLRVADVLYLAASPLMLVLLIVCAYFMGLSRGRSPSPTPFNSPPGYQQPGPLMPNNGLPPGYQPPGSMMGRDSGPPPGFDQPGPPIGHQAGPPPAWSGNPTPPAWSGNPTLPDPSRNSMPPDWSGSPMPPGWSGNSIPPGWSSKRRPSGFGPVVGGRGGTVRNITRPPGADDRDHPDFYRVNLAELRSADSAHRMFALMVLENAEPKQLQEEIAKELQNILLHDPQVFVRRKCLKVLCHWSGADATPTVIGLLHDSDYPIKSEALEFLAKQKDPRAVEPLVVLLFDSPTFKLEEALKEMGSMVEDSLIKHLSPMIGAKKLPAIRVLGAVATKKGLAELRKIAASNDPPAAFEARRILEERSDNDKGSSAKGGE